jgi:hypothetical protein
MQPDPLGELRQKLLGAFDPYVEREAQALVAVLNESLLFSKIDQSRRQFVVDRRAIVLAMLFVGADKYYASYASTASWFADWLRSRLPGRPVETLLLKARHSPTGLLAFRSKDFRPVASASMRTILPTAAEYAERTMARPRAGLRHLFVAILTDPDHILEIEELGWKLGPGDRDDLCNTLLRHVAADPERGERVEAWRPILEMVRPMRSPDSSSASPSPSATAIPHEDQEGPESKSTIGPESATAPPPPPSEETGAHPPPLPPPSPAFLVSGFSADRTTDHSSDPLETEADVLAMARLICHEDADPPISIGVFGGWGSGKSTFMEALQWEVAVLADPAAKRVQPKEGPRFVSPVVQIRFNAWQFADADLWTSLTAEFFDQLRAGGFEGGGKRIHAQLVEKVNEHVRGLGKEAAERRAALARADDKLRTAQAVHDEAVRRKDTDVRQALVSGLAEAFEKNRAGLARLSLVDPRSADQLAQFIEIAKDVRTLRGQVKRILMMLLRHWILLLGIAVIMAALAWAAIEVTGKDLAGAIAAAAGAGAALLPLVRSGLKAIRSVVSQTAPFAHSIAEAEQKGLKAVLDSEVKLRLAAEESEALRAASDRADRALARYVDPAARANPPRVLRYLLEDDPNTKAFEKEIGLLGRARRLFQALDQIVADNRLKQEKARAADRPVEQDADRPDPDIPARIILYIDDLDRCTHEQVYKVLQAVHLLLAFELFVVVVAVDVAWIEAALARSIEFAGADTDDEALKEAARRQRAIEYLSKIFQLPFWLKPFSGKDDTRYANYVRSLTRVAASDSGGEPDEGGQESVRTLPPPLPPSDGPDHGGDAQDEEASAEGGGTEGVEQSGEEGAAGDEIEGAEDSSTSGTDSDEVARALRTLQLTRAEEDFLASAQIAGLAASDPRGVKRLVNVYKIVRSRLSETDESMILGGRGTPPDFPLIALFAAIETGQPLEVADKFYTELKDGGQERLLSDIQLGGELKVAVAAVIEAREGKDVPVGEALAIAGIVRRYSFNRFH